MKTPRFLATAIGSMPHTDVNRALDIVFESVPQAPIWPQLPKRDLLEQILKSEEEHIDFLETQLEIMERIGEERYMQSQLEVDAKA